MRLAEPLDQATGLRRLFAPEPPFRSLGVLGPDPAAATRVSVALARGLGRRGGRVLLLDEANAPHHAGGLLGVLARHTLGDARQQGLPSLAQPAGDGIVLLAAPDGPAALAAWSEAELRDLAEDWRARVEAPEWLLVNGAGRTPEQALAATADERVLVLPGTRNKLADAYAVLKQAQARWSASHWRVLVDGAGEDTAQELFASLADTARRFLGLEADYLGHLPRARAGQPPQLLDGARMDRLAEQPPLEAGAGRVNFEQYWQRMWLHSRMLVETGRPFGRQARR